MIFPFSAIVGQDQMKLGLILNVIDPGVGGLLIMGEKGTGKSTTVRALAELLPEMDVVAGCPFGCDPDGEVLCSSCAEEVARGGALRREKRKMKVVELPLGVTEDRLVGTLDIEHALRRGEKRFEPGILADANRNFLYVDEVNLLEDHIVDLLLDSAAMGKNTVEREGVSFVHPARFILVGTMNPEEGELRPQLLDRFGLSVYVLSIRDKDLRVSILKRRSEFDLHPVGFLAAWKGEQDGLGEKISRATERVLEIEMGDELLELLVEITLSMNVDGHRSDIVMAKAARALAALRGMGQVTKSEIGDVARLALNHRLRRLPFEEVGSERRKMEETLARFTLAGGTENA